MKNLLRSFCVPVFVIILLTISSYAVAKKATMRPSQQANIPTRSQVQLFQESMTKTTLQNCANLYQMMALALVHCQNLVGPGSIHAIRFPIGRTVDGETGAATRRDLVCFPDKAIFAEVTAAFNSNYYEQCRVGYENSSYWRHGCIRVSQVDAWIILVKDKLTQDFPWLNDYTAIDQSVGSDTPDYEWDDNNLSKNSAYYTSFYNVPPEIPYLEFYFRGRSGDLKLFRAIAGYEVAKEVWDMVSGPLYCITSDIYLFDNYCGY